MGVDTSDQTPIPELEPARIPRFGDSIAERYEQIARFELHSSPR